MTSWICPHCCARPQGRYAVIRHMRNLWKDSNDPDRCDNVQELPSADTQTTTPTSQHAKTTAGVPRQRQHQHRGPAPLHSLARRQSQTLQLRRQARKCYVISSNRVDTSGCRDMASVQADWERYKQDVRSSCCKKFWDFFLPLHTFSGVCIDTALAGARKVFMQEGGCLVHVLLTMHIKYHH